MAYLWDSVPAQVADTEEEFATQHAANLLRVSRAQLIGLLDTGEIDYRTVGPRRRVRAGSLREYQHRRSSTSAW